MSIIIASVVTWFAVTVFSLIPKKLTPFEMLFLFFINTIFELSSFSVLNVNFKFITIPHGISNAIADLMYRIVELPLLLVTSTNILLYSNKAIKWCGVVAIILFTLIVQEILVKIGLLYMHHWNVIYSGIYVCGGIIFSRVMIWLITFIEAKEIT